MELWIYYAEVKKNWVKKPKFTKMIYIYILCIIVFHMDNYWLVVSIPLKNIKVSWGYYFQYMEK